MKEDNPFTLAIKDFSRANHWEISYLGEDRTLIEINSQSGRLQTAIIELQEEHLRFLVPGMAVFVDEFDLDHDVSTTLLKRNSNIKKGSWIFIEINSEWMYAFQYFYALPNRDIDLDMNGERMQKVLNELITECERFDDYWENERM